MQIEEEEEEEEEGTLLNQWESSRQEHTIVRLFCPFCFGYLQEWTRASSKKDANHLHFCMGVVMGTYKQCNGSIESSLQKDLDRKHARSYSIVFAVGVRRSGAAPIPSPENAFLPSSRFPDQRQALITAFQSEASGDEGICRMNTAALAKSPDCTRRSTTLV
jgi:hypothetical protein